MDFEINYLSFYVITVDGKDEQANKHFKHFQTLDTVEYEDSALKDFLDGELTKIVKRKVERHPRSEQVPTKIGHFAVEPGHDLTSNPNFNLFDRIRTADTKEAFTTHAEELLRIYLDTSAVRGGAFLIAKAKPAKYFDDTFVFIMKCDFEQKVATITDESTLLKKVEMAITTKNMKSIQYPYMPEEGMMEDGELKIHQASHARYFEDFLKYVEYGEAMPTIMKSQVKAMVEEHIEETLEEHSVEKADFEQAMEIWDASEKREIQERLDTHQVVEANALLIEQSPEIDLSMKLGHIGVNALLSDFGDNVHIAKVNGRYITIIESDSIVFDKGFSPIEFLKPDDVESVIQQVLKKAKEMTEL